MLNILRADSTHPDFISLVHLLDQDLQIRDGADHSFFKQFNKIDNLKHVVVAYKDFIPVGCGAIKAFDKKTAEVKRMFVLADMRGQGIAEKILRELENWATELGYSYTILETGKKQPEAIRLYEKSNYERIPNYGQYIGVLTSVCMTKKLN